MIVYSIPQFDTICIYMYVLLCAVLFTLFRLFFSFHRALMNVIRVWITFWCYQQI